MLPWNMYPYKNITDLNLDWIERTIKELEHQVKDFVSLNAIKYANPIQWNIVQSYEKNTIVIDPLTGTAYISVAPVPSGVAITRTDYWTVVFDLESFVVRAAKNFTNHYEAETTLTATFATNEGGWLVWGDVLYIAQTNITAGDSYVVNGNIKHITVEELHNFYIEKFNEIIGIIGDLESLNTTDKTTIVSAINSLIDNMNTIIDGINDTIDGINDTIDGINDTIDGINGTIDGINDTIGDINNAIDGINSDITAINDTIAELNTTNPSEIANSNGAITRLFNVADSYIKHNNELQYGNFHGAFNTTVTNEIDCSTFTELCLKGITFENSRYSLGSAYANILGSGYYFEDEIIDEGVDRPYGMLANDLCEYADSHGYGYEITDIDKVRVGDVLFVANSPYDEYYKHIGHCGLILNKNKYNNSLLVLSANTNNPTIPVNIETWFLSNSQVKWAARFPLQDASMEINNLIGGYYTKNRLVNVSIDAGAILGGVVQHLGIPNGYNAGEVYTMIMTVDRLPIGIHLGLYGTYGGSYKFIQNMGGAGRDTVITSTFFIPADYNNADTSNDLTGPYVRAVIDSAQATDYTASFRIKSLAVIKGVAIPNGEEFEMPSIRAIATNYTLTNKYTITSDAELTSALLDSVSSLINFTSTSYRINVSTDLTYVSKGRYRVEAFAYGGGMYGYFKLTLISGYVSGKYAEVFVCNSNGTLNYQIVTTLV